MGKLKRLLILAVVGQVLVASVCSAEDILSHVLGGVLSGDPDYDWYYGCSPTSAGMMMGYYDGQGYDNLYYPDLVPGGVAELSTFGTGDYLANDIIASQGHIDDFWVAYGSTKKDPMASNHSFDCLADFMGTSQYVLDSKPGQPDNTDGGTTFWFYTDGSAITDSDLYDLGSDYWNTSGLYGIREYAEYAGYMGSGFNQYIDEYVDGGFTFGDYMAEIDAGRPVLIHVDGHSMFGYGYDETGVVLHDTWTEGLHSMTWGASYPYGPQELAHYGVTVFELAGGVPEPAGLSLIALGVGAFVARRARRKRAAEEGDA